MEKNYPCGAEEKYFAWSRPRRPLPLCAELWLLTPDGSEVLICQREDHPACCMGAYGSTPEEGEVYEVVDVGFGTHASHYRGKRLAGKLALSSGHQFSAVMLEALTHRGAAGLLCGPGSAGIHSARLKENRLEDPEIFGDLRPFGFNLSATQYHRLLNLLASGDTLRMRVKLTVVPDAESLSVLSAVLWGSGQAGDRLLMVGDTGQGLSVAVLVEVLCVLDQVIAAGDCPPLERGLEVLLAPGMQGSVAWLADHQQELGRLKGALVLDLETMDSSTRTLLHRSPLGRRSFITDLLEDHFRWAAFVDGPFRTGRTLRFHSANRRSPAPTLPFANRDMGLPATWIRGHQPRQGKAGGAHDALHRLVAAMTCSVLDLCNLGPQDLPRLICNSHLSGQQRLGRRAKALRQEIRQEMHRDAPSSTAARHLLWRIQSNMQQGIDQERGQLNSCCDYLAGPGQQALRLAEVNADLEQFKVSLIRSLHAEVASNLGPRARLTVRRAPLSALERRANAVLPRCLYAGPLPAPLLLRLAPESERAWLAQHADALAKQPSGEEQVQWIDGRRTLLQIFDLLSLEHPEADLKLFWRYLEVLQGAGLLELLEDDKTAEA